MLLRKFYSACSIIVLLTMSQIVMAGSTPSAAQTEMMEAMKSGDSARIMKAANAMTAQHNAPNNSGKQMAPNKNGMPTLSATDHDILKSAEAKRILTKHAQLTKSNSRQASDIEVKALRAKVASDWHKQHPNESREPTTAETYKTIMMMQMNPEIRNLALVQYYPSMEKQQKELADAQAKMSRTPHYDKLTPDQQLAVKWTVVERYRELHNESARNGKINGDLVEIHGVDLNKTNNDFKRMRNAFLFSPAASRTSILIADPSGGAPSRHYTESKEYIGETAVWIKLRDMGREFVKNFPDNPAGLRKWQMRLWEGYATDPEHLDAYVRNFRGQQAFERNVKIERINAIQPWPAGTDKWESYIANDFNTPAGRLLNKDIELVSKRAVFESAGCEWVKGVYSEKNPSSLCDSNGKTLPLTP